MDFLFVTDIEGVAGIDSFSVTRAETAAGKAPAMDQLAREVGGAIEGVRSVHPDGAIDVWDGHGSGGLSKADVADATYQRAGQPYFHTDHDGGYFVGQHAMAGAPFAPLRHTYSSRHVAYYKLNGTFIGEFGARALIAGKRGVPTVFLSGDDKACYEADAFVPGIETVAVKEGRGEEAAEHMGQGAAVEAVREGAARAAERVGEIDPLTDFSAPYELEMRFQDPIDDDYIAERGGERVDEYTMRVFGEDIADPEGAFGGIL
jgi:D-amino peptidase